MGAHLSVIWAPRAARDPGYEEENERLEQRWRDQYKGPIPIPTGAEGSGDPPTAPSIHANQIYGGDFHTAGRDVIHVLNHNYGSAPLAGPTPNDLVARCSEILDWIAPCTTMNTHVVQMDTLAKAAPGTGTWVFRDEVFHRWNVSEEGILCGEGMPGAGKSVLMSIIAESLKGETEASDTMSLAFDYLSSPDDLSPEVILADIARQKLDRALQKLFPRFFPYLEQIFERHKRQNTRLSLKELTEIIKDTSEPFQRNIYLLDGIDRLPSEHQIIIIQTLSSLDHSHILVTSRHFELLKSRFPRATHFEIVAQQEDVRLLIEHKINLNVAFCNLLERHGLKQKVIDVILRKSNGMFLHAFLQIEMLRHCLSIRQLRKDLAKFPPKLEDMYIKTMARVNAQNKYNAQLARRILLWVLYAAREMTMEELQYAVAVDPGTHDIDEECSIDEASMVSVCCGLIRVDKKSGLVRLIHSTAKDVLKSLMFKYNIDPHSTIAKICMNLLITCKFPCAPFETADEFREMEKNAPVLSYAYKFWAFHAKASNSLCDPSSTEVTAFVLKCKHYPFIRTFWKYQDSIDFLTPLHVAAQYGLHQTMVQLLTKVKSYPIMPDKELLGFSFESPVELVPFDVNAKTPQCALTPLMLASIQGYDQVVGILVNRDDLDVNHCSDTGETALTFASRCREERVVERLLLAPGIKINLANSSGEAPLMIAAGGCTPGATQVVERLLSFPGVSVNIVDASGYTPLMRACVTGNETLVRRLLQVPTIEVNMQDFSGNTAIILAAKYGRDTIVQQLLEFNGIKVGLINHQGQTAFREAEAHRHKRVLRAFREDARVDEGKFIDIFGNATEPQRRMFHPGSGWVSSGARMRVLYSQPPIDSTHRFDTTVTYLKLDSDYTITTPSSNTSFLRQGIRF